MTWLEIAEARVAEEASCGGTDPQAKIARFTSALG